MKINFMNAILSLVLLLAITQTAVAADTLFSDDFEAATIDTAKWDTIADTVEIDSTPANVNSGANAAAFHGDGTNDELESIVIDTTGYENIVLDYAVMTDSLDVGEEFTTEYSVDDGTTWQNIETLTGTAAYGDKSFLLGTDADDITTLRIRFYIDANNNSLDNAYLDDVEVSADVIDFVLIINPMAGLFYSDIITIDWTQSGLVDLDIHYMTGIVDCQDLSDWTYTNNSIANDIGANVLTYDWDVSGLPDDDYCLQIQDDSSSSIYDIVGHFTIDTTAPV
ncbi:MAG: hypothetical protein ACI83O_000883, partial [Patescibacteria group bacterium]